MKRGIYRTIYGNAAIVTSPRAKSAWDIDGGERIPIELVEPDQFIRPVTQDDLYHIDG
jgi:hypothetical protein